MGTIRSTLFLVGKSDRMMVQEEHVMGWMDHQWSGTVFLEVIMLALEVKDSKWDNKWSRGETIRSGGL